MKRRLFLSLLIVLLVCLLPTVAAESGPQPPSWVPASEYAVFPNTSLYDLKSWRQLSTLRTYAAEGGKIMDLSKSPVSGSFAALNKDFVGQYPYRYELCLIYYKIAQNKGSELTDADRELLALPHPLKLYAGSLDAKNSYGVNLWVARSNIRLHAYSSTDVKSIGLGAHFTAMKQLLKEPAFSVDLVYQHPAMELFDPNTVEQYRNTVFVLVDDTYFASPYPTIDSGRFSRMDYAKLVGARTMVPLRFLAEPLGLKVGWDDSSSTVVLKGHEKTITLGIGAYSAIVDGAPVTLDAPVFLEQGRTYVPLRFVSEALGTTVSWHEEKNLVQLQGGGITIAGSNLIQWAVPMGAVLNDLNESTGYSGACFAARESTPYNAGDRDSASALWFSVPNSQSSLVNQEARNILAKSWEIDNREELVDTVLHMTVLGHNKDYFEIVDSIKNLSDYEYKKLLSGATEVEAYMYPFTKQLYAKWGDRGILCFDLFRMSNLVQWGYDARYLSLEEALALLEPAAQLLQSNFHSWDEAYENYVDGYNWWARNNVLKQKTMDTERGLLYQGLKTRYPSLFSDPLFEAKPTPVQGLSFLDLLPTKR